MTPEEIVAILTTIGFQERLVGDYSPEEVQEAIDYAIDAVRQLNYRDIDNRTIGASSEIDDDREWLNDIEPYGYINRADSFDKFTAEDWAYYLTSNWDWMDESDYYDLLDDINNLRGAEWVRDYEDDLRKLDCFEEFAKFTNAYQILEYDTDIESEIFDYCDEIGGYADFDQKVEDIAENWGMPKELANRYVWNWSIQVKDEE